MDCKYCRLVFATLLLLVLVVSGSHAAVKTNPQVIIMYDNYFSPRSITIKAGEQVTWINRGDNNHTVTSSNGQFRSGYITPGAKFSHVFKKPGIYRYRCRLHTLFWIGMTGTVIVK